MFSITLITMGKLKEKFYISARRGIQKASGRILRLYASRAAGSQTSENPSPGEIEAGLEKEAELIFSKIPKGSWFCVLTPEGRSYPAKPSRTSSGT